MTASLTHRGPDGAGVKEYRECVLGHRRLAIIDIATGAQPMTSTDGHVAVTFNGEIYGYKQLRRQTADYRYRTSSDTEVLLALYQQHGPQMLTHLPGMFAFAIWDEERRELFAARDRFGEKPLYYAFGRNGEFIFASEIKAILASELIDPVIDRRMVARYLQRQCVLPGKSIFENIQLLPPAHLLRFANGRVDVSRYWSFPCISDDIGLEDAAETFRSLLDCAVQKQLVSDVPVGAFLSGGLDSSTISFVAGRHLSQLHTFSFVFDGDLSEAPFARSVAEAYGTQHIELETAGISISQGLLKLAAIYDEPFADSSALPTYLLAREARRHAKVVLTGDGGDELFGGYDWYKPLIWMVNEGRIGMLRWVVERTLNRLAALTRLPGAAARELRIMGMGLGRAHDSPLQAHKAQMLAFSSHDLVLLGLGDASPEDIWGHCDEVGSVDDAIRLDVADYMPADILTKIDRASMANGLELRAPFLDLDFASFCLTLPYRLKVSTRGDKRILREAYGQKWPVPIRGRSKQGFGAPISRWLKDSSVSAIKGRLLDDRGSPLYELLPFDGVQKVLAGTNSMQEWTLLTLGVWAAHQKEI